jgi:hypothetical protein
MVPSGDHNEVSAGNTPSQGRPTELSASEVAAARELVTQSNSTR